MTATATTDVRLSVVAIPSVSPVERLVLFIAAAKVAFFIAIAGVWGIHRDEFYYLAGGRRLDWGYVDHPPMTPFLYRVGETLFGSSQVGMHTVAALVGGALVVVGALIAREMGGGRTAQIVAALGVATSPMLLGTSHFLSTVSVDLLMWSVGLLLVVRLLRTSDVRLWLPIGVVAGIGLLNKHSMIFWAIGVVVGLLCTRERSLLRSGAFVVGLAIAGAIALPHLVWQVQHDWASIEFLRSLQSHTDMISNPVLYFPFQLVLFGPVLAFIWIPGVVWLLRSDDANRFRALAFGYFVVLVMLFLLRGKAYYVGSWYPALFAAGSVRLERAARRPMRFYVALLLAGAVMAAPFAIPVVPSTSSAARFFAEADEELGELLGWDEMVTQVAAVARALPQEDRSQLTILTSNYSEAGALEYWRDELDLPQPISPQNSYWLWGYGDATQNDTVIAIGFDRAELEGFFSDVQLVDTIRNDAGVENKEFGKEITVCRGLRVPWSEMWPRLKDFG